MDPSSSISFESEFAVDEQAVQVEITTPLKSELYKTATPKHSMFTKGLFIPARRGCHRLVKVILGKCESANHDGSFVMSR
ncbi:hypothetical protein QQP08_014047 [Theobroma cacao]|nr:hypothetical protein QQP08_014047 [Theobroma cacao]